MVIPSREDFKGCASLRNLLREFLMKSQLPSLLKWPKRESGGFYVEVTKAAIIITMPLERLCYMYQKRRDV